MAALVGRTATSAATSDVLWPEDFGAKGDGRTNDTAAFAALSAEVNARGGGTVALRPVTYIVGRHAPPGARIANDPRPFAFPPGDILHFVGCRGPVVVRGNGATLRASGGLRYGTFDPQTGRPFQHPMPFIQQKFAASPYLAMIFAEGCSGLVDISDVELDGRVSALELGGPYGDVGWQIPATGIRLSENSGPERLSGIYTHHHALDGITLFGPVDRLSSTTLADVKSEFNGRQGCSLTGGRNYSFARCKFAGTGKGGLRNAPGAGVDIEAGRHPIRNVSFSECEFSNNSGPGLLADKGDSESASFERCTFVGTSSWSAYPNKPGFGFSNCRFVGSIPHAYGDPDPANAAQFHACTFSDDPTLSPTRKVFGGPNGRGTIAWLPNTRNVLFDRCGFRLVDDLLLPRSTAVIYSDCEMSQRAPRLSHPAGTYLGVNRITANADLSGSTIRGEVILNGRRLML